MVPGRVLEVDDLGELRSQDRSGQADGVDLAIEYAAVPIDRLGSLEVEIHEDEVGNDPGDQGFACNEEVPGESAVVGERTAQRLRHAQVAVEEVHVSSWSGREPGTRCARRGRFAVVGHERRWRPPVVGKGTTTQHTDADTVAGEPRMDPGQRRTSGEDPDSAAK